MGFLESVRELENSGKFESLIFILCLTRQCPAWRKSLGWLVWTLLFSPSLFVLMVMLPQKGNGVSTTKLCVTYFSLLWSYCITVALPRHVHNWHKANGNWLKGQPSLLFWAVEPLTACWPLCTQWAHAACCRERPEMSWRDDWGIPSIHGNWELLAQECLAVIWNGYDLNWT